MGLRFNTTSKSVYENILVDDDVIINTQFYMHGPREFAVCMCEQRNKERKKQTNKKGQNKKQKQSKTK